MPGDEVPLRNKNVLDETIHLWEYKWSLDDEEVHGPFSTVDMRQWIDSGFFSKDAVVVRLVTSSTSLDGFKGFIVLSESELASEMTAGKE